MKRKYVNTKSTDPLVEEATNKTAPHSTPTSGKHGERKKAKPDAEDYTIEQVAERLNCSDKTVRRRIKSGELRATRDGGMIRIPVAEYLRYRAKRNPVI